MTGPTSRRARTRRLAALAALLCCAAIVTPVSAGEVKTCGPGGTVEDIGNGWLLSRPTFPSGPAEVTAIAAPVFDPNLVYATNGVSIVRTRDAGCAWKAVFTAQPAVAGATAAITALAVPSSANNSSYVYVGVTSTLAGVTTPSIEVSDKYGDSWLDVAGSGLPQLGRVSAIAVSPQVQLVAYAVLDTAIPSVLGGATLYSTSDAGATWNARGDSGSFTVGQLAVDPVRQAALYGVKDGRPVRSLDNGATFAPTRGDPGSVADFATAPGAGSIRLAASRADGRGVVTSDDGGTSWRTLRTPEAPGAVAMAPLQDVVAASGPGDVWLLAAGRTVTVTPTDAIAPEQLALSAPTQVGYALTGVAAGGVVRVNFALGTTNPIPTPKTARLKPVLLLPATPVSQFASLLLPPRFAVSLKAGETRRVPYRLLVPRTPTPADVMFLLDSTSSYGGIIDSLREGVARIVNALDAAGLDVRFGVGNFQDYPSPYGPSESDDVPYELDRRIGPGDASFAAAVGGIVAEGGTTDGGQSAYTAIYQAMTGTGEVVRGKRMIKPGLDAGYRPDAMRFVMTSTDTEPHHRGQRVRTGDGTTVIEPGPTVPQVVAALRAKGVRAIGIPAFYEGGPTAVQPLRDLAAASGARAPLGGVDCDGNGSVDLATNDPLVCVLGQDSSTDSTSGIAAAVVGLVTSVHDPKPVTLRVTQGADRARIVSATVHTVDMHADNEIPYDVELSCPRAAAKTYAIGLQSSTPDRMLAGGGIELSCGGLAGVVAPAALEPPLPPRAAAANAVPDVKVNVNSNTQTNPNPNPNPHAQPVANAQTGFAYEQQQGFQLALAEDQGARAQLGEEYAMSGRPLDPGPGLGLGAAAMLAGATGVALRRRRQVQPAAARARR